MRASEAAGLLTEVGGRSSAEDLFQVRWVHDARISPDGSRVACSIHAVDRDLDGYVSFVEIVDVGNGASRSLSPERVRDHSPRWSPDGTWILFTSNREGDDQLWLADPDGRSMRRLTDSPGGVTEPAWAPDRRMIAFVATTAEKPRDPEAVWEVATLRFKTDGQPVTAKSMRRHIWLLELDDPPRVRQITDGDWNDWSPVWSPDGGTIAFLSNRDPNREFTDASAIHLIGPAGGEPRRLRDVAGGLRSLAWAPDGSAIAAIGHQRGDAQGVDDHVLLFDLKGGPPRSLTEHLGLSAGMYVRGDDFRSPPAPLQWPPGAWLYFPYCVGGSGRVGRVNLTGAFETILAGDRAVLSYGVTPDGTRCAFVAADPFNPGELSVRELEAAGPERRLTDHNADWMGGRSLAHAEILRWNTPDGYSVEGWLYRHPDVGADPAPLVVAVHGGPHYPIGARFSLEWQRLAALGLCVLAPNPRGSQGYGEAFATASWGDWGGGDYRDVLGIVEESIRRGEADRHRLGITGVSYGGYLTNWAISQTNIFAAAIAENSISDLWSSFGVSGEFCELWISDLRGAPWETPEAYTERSPLRHVDKIRTPLLLIHAENDQNCPIGQSEELFVALRYLGREARFLRLPGEGHLMNLYGRPSRRLVRMAAVDEWWKRYLRPTIGP